MTALWPARRRETLVSPSRGDRAPTPSKPDGRGVVVEPLDACRTETMLTAGLICGLAWAPFWLGANRLPPWGVDAALFPGLALAYEASLVLRGRAHPFAARRIAVPAGLFVVVVAWIVAQMSSCAPRSFAHPIWTMASDVLGASLPATISVDRPATARALMRLLTDASVLWLSMQLCRDSSRALLVLRAIAVIAVAYAIYGLTLSFAFGGAIPFFEAPAGGGLVRSTFVNRTSYAAYAGLGLITMTGLTLRFYRHAVPDAAGIARYRLARTIAATGQGGMLHIGGGLVVLVALLGTESRGGVLSTALGLVAVIALSAARRRRKRGDRLEAIALLAAALAATFLVFGDHFRDRVAASGATDESRLAVYRIAARAVWDSPLLGFGYGTFADVFPMYRDRSIPTSGVWDLAHNTYLETWLGLGLAFGTALMAALGLLVLKCLVGSLRRRRDSVAPSVATAAALAVGAHALVDFSLQMQAVSLTFMALLGAGVAQSESSRHVVQD
jgi:O-antigen ligase